MPFAVDLIHTKTGGRRVEFVTPKSLVLQADGRTSLGRVGGRNSHPEALFLQRHLPRELLISFHVVGARQVHDQKPPQLPLVNGAPLERGNLNHGDVVHWRDYRVTVSELRPLRAPEWAMVEAARSDDAALNVYADWLETGGAIQSAEWTRLTLSPRSEAELARMNALALRVGGSFRALVSRGPVERCNEPVCGQRWEKLALRPEPWVRDCAACKRPVTWVEEPASARSVHGPVTLDPATPRSPGDLLPRPVMVG